MSKPTKETIKKASLIQLSDYIVNNLPQMAIHNNDLYMYNGKYYEELTDHEIGQRVFDYFLDVAPSVWSPAKAKNIIEGIKYHPNIRKVKEFDQYNNLLNLNNGVLNMDTRELIAHKPEYNFTTAVDVDYNPEALDASFFIKTLQQIFLNPDGTYDSGSIENVLQLGGYLIYPQTKINGLFIFYGEGSNGKSIIMDEVYQMFFDEKFISALSLNTLSKESAFARKLLMTSRVNFATEQKADVIESEEIKKITDGSNISIARKFKDEITFKPKTKILVACNKLPRFKDTTYGTKRRLFILKFKNQFMADKTLYNQIENPGKKRIFLAGNKDEIVANLKKEKSAIFNLFLESLDILKKNNWIFKHNKNTEEVMEEYNEESDPTGQWIKDNFEIDETETEIIDLPTIVREYNEWYMINNNDQKYMSSSRAISKKIKDLFRIESFKYTKRDSNGLIKCNIAFNLKRKINKWEEAINNSQTSESLDQPNIFGT